MRRLARQTFGFEQLGPGQEEAIRAAAGGRDVLAVLPTDAGKSAIYRPVNYCFASTSPFGVHVVAQLGWHRRRSGSGHR